MCRVFVIALLLLGPSYSNSDNLALLLDTLKTEQRAICDEEMVSIKCPNGTAISILVAQYGKAVPENSPCSVSNVGNDEDTNCKLPNSMQYSLLQTVVEACQKKAQCKFSTKPKPDIANHCPFPRMYVEVSYKCRPHEFKSNTVCENEVMKLSCPPKTRIAIYDAHYGRFAYETTCSQSSGVVNETCLTPYTVEKVMQTCLGKRRCQIVANSRTFESYCSPQTSPYFKIVYACVPLGIISERYESATEVDEREDSFSKNDDLMDNSGASETRSYTNPGSPIADPALLPPLTSYVTPPSNRVGDTTVFTSSTNIEQTKDLASNYKLYLLVGIIVAIFAILVLVYIGVRCYLKHRSKDDSKNGDMFSAEAPNVFNDAVSDIDNDVDVSHFSGTFYDPLHPDMILYKDVPGTRGTLRAMKPLSTIYPIAGANMYGNVDYVPSQSREIPTRFTRSRSKEEQMSADLVMSPKSLATYSNSQYYYG